MNGPPGRSSSFVPDRTVVPNQQFEHPAISTQSTKLLTVSSCCLASACFGAVASYLIKLLNTTRIVPVHEFCVFSGLSFGKPRGTISLRVLMRCDYRSDFHVPSASDILRFRLTRASKNCLNCAKIPRRSQLGHFPRIRFRVLTTGGRRPCICHPFIK